MSRVQKGKNDLKTWCYKNNREDLLLDWDYEKNPFSPEEVSFGSNQYALWKCDKCGHSWSAIIGNRSRLNRGCPECGKRKRKKSRLKTGLAAIGSLAETHPQLAKEWHPTKNGNLMPTDVMAGTAKKVWWYLPYDDEKTGKHFDFEWQAYIGNRALKGSGCPFLNGAVWPGFNDLESVNPELAKEWDSEKNEVTADHVSANDNKKYWWRCLKCGFEWEAKVANRNQLGRGCPECGKQLSSRNYRSNYLKNNVSLAESNPELASQWHPTKNGLLKPEDITAGSSEKVWWFLPYDDIKTGKHFDFEWRATISSRNAGVGCPFLKGKLWKGFNDITVTNPEVTRFWNYSKNRRGPENYTKGSHKKVWWIGECGHEFSATIASECAGRFSCPICSRERQTSFPEQAIYYYIKKVFPNAINGDKTLGRELDIYIPEKNIAIEYDGSAWHKNIENDLSKDELCYSKGITLYRIRENGCESIDSRYAILYQYEYGKWDELGEIIRRIIANLSDEVIDVDIERDENTIYEMYLGEHQEKSVSALYPEIEEFWHPTKNGAISLKNVLPASDKIFWWTDEYNHEYRCQVKLMIRGGNHCPYCNNRKLLKGFNDLQTKYPEVAAEWDNEKNDIGPDSVIYNKGKFWFKCKKCGYRWQALLSNRTRLGVGCPECGREKQREARSNSSNHSDHYGKLLSDIYPNLAKEWDTEKNGIPADEIRGFSTYKNKFWWICSACGNNWKSTIKNRTKGHGCPKCSSLKQYKKVKNVDTGDVYDSVNEAAEATGCSASGITNCCKGRTKTCKGYHWKYADK